MTINHVNSNRRLRKTKTNHKRVIRFYQIKNKQFVTIS